MYRGLSFDHVTFMAAPLSPLVSVMSVLKGLERGGERFQLPCISQKALGSWDSIHAVSALIPRPCVSLQVLVRTELQGIRYKFNAPISRDASNQYSWHYTPWTKCSVLCAGGEV